MLKLIRKLKKGNLDFNANYDNFINYLLDNLSINELDFIKNKGVNYVSDLFYIYVNDNDKLINKIYYDYKNK